MKFDWRSLLRCSMAVVLVALLPAMACAQRSGDVERILRLIADRVLAETSFQFEDRVEGRRYSSTAQAPSGASLRLVSSSNDWRYWNGVLNLAFAGLGDRLGDSRYVGFAAKNIAFAFDNSRYFEERHTDESKWEYPFGQYFMMEELDDCGAMGAATIGVYRRDPQSRYRAYIDRAAKHIEARQSRLEDGTLVRTFPRKWTLWADDLYMGVSFLVRMGEMSGEAKYFDDAATQVTNFHKYLSDSLLGVMHHCWYSDVGRQGVALWGRANGWALVAQTDLLDLLPKDHVRRDTLLSLLRRHIQGIVRLQSSGGLWHQLLDREDSYLETSCSAMFCYAIARAINRGYIGNEYTGSARLAWLGVQSKVHSDGQIEGICAGTGVDEDLAHYYKRPTPLNDPHGVGAVLLAGAEVLRLGK